MLMREVNGWADAVNRASQLWPQIPAWAIERAGEEEMPEGTYYTASWFSLHPRRLGEAAARIAGVEID